MLLATLGEGRFRAYASILYSIYAHPAIFPKCTAITITPCLLTFTWLSSLPLLSRCQFIRQPKVGLYLPSFVQKCARVPLSRCWKGMLLHLICSHRGCPSFWRCWQRDNYTDNRGCRRITAFIESLALCDMFVSHYFQLEILFPCVFSIPLWMPCSRTLETLLHGRTQKELSIQYITTSFFRLW